ncbi:MAG: ATP-binding protein [Phycisphaerales bacterium]|nr:ATP-binding protein [Phycisphaerales bacterium]
MTRPGSNPGGSSSDDPVATKDTVVLKDDRAQVERFQARFMNALAQCGYDEAASFAVRLSLEEALANGFRHGNKGDSEKTVTIEYDVEPDQVRIAVQDEGSGFDPTAVPDPTEDANLEIPSGRGIMLIRAYMSEVRFQPPGNRLEMVFRLGK